MQVDYQQTYLLRIINAVMNEEKFFAIANHSLTVVAQDASYVQRFTSNYILISPGQTIDVLVTANQNIGQYYMATRPFSDGANPLRSNITTGVFQYTNSNSGLNASLITLPGRNDLDSAMSFLSRIRNSNVTQNPKVTLPSDIDRRIYIAIATNTNEEEERSIALASMNNFSFVLPRSDILQAYYNRSIDGVFTTDFPLEPPVFFNFTENQPPIRTSTNRGTRAFVLNYGEAVEIVFQATNLGGGGSHPIHLHGFSFYWVGIGSGNFNNVTDPSTYNLVDPPLINTVHVPVNGWAAIRFFATNPGVWFMHCHFERHSSLGMDTVLIVKNGTTVDESIRPPPASGMPRCLGN